MTTMAVEPDFSAQVSRVSGSSSSFQTRVLSSALMTRTNAGRVDISVYAMEAGPRSSARSMV